MSWVLYLAIWGFDDLRTRLHYTITHKLVISFTQILVFSIFNIIQKSVFLNVEL